MTTTQKPLSFDDATLPASHEPAADVRAWQAEKIKAGVKDADAGRFATREAIKAVIQKFIPIG
jgi:predicted transcriptional regulator